MATQPKTPPEPRRRPAQILDFPLREKRHFLWPAVILVVAAVILAVLIATLPRAPRAQAPPVAAQIPQRPTGDQIQLSGLRIVPAPTSGAFYLTGQLSNEGPTSISGIVVELDLQNQAGQTLLGEQVPVEGVIPRSNPPQAQNLAEAPIKPQEKRVFRVRVIQVPAGWNHDVPEVKILQVTGSP